MPRCCSSDKLVRAYVSIRAVTNLYLIISQRLLLSFSWNKKNGWSLTDRIYGLIDDRILCFGRLKRLVVKL